jgi:CBS domain-containing protein
VLDGSGVLIGLVTKTDVVCEFFDFEHEPPTDVSDVMTQRPVTVRETSTLAEVVTLLSTTHHHLPVLSADGRVVGIISALDIIQWLASSLR